MCTLFLNTFSLDLNSWQSRGATEAVKQSRSYPWTVYINTLNISLFKPNLLHQINCFCCTSFRYYLSYRCGQTCLTTRSSDMVKYSAQSLLAHPFAVKWVANCTEFSGLQSFQTFWENSLRQNYVVCDIPTCFLLTVVYCHYETVISILLRGEHIPSECGVFRHSVVVFYLKAGVVL